jgi:uroporphyrin-3 C-methyltransferase
MPLRADAEEFERLNQAVNEQLAVSRSLQMAGEALQRRLSAAESALAGVASRELDAGGELDMAEVDYLLRLANERLKLFHDPVAADETLELADMHLAAMDDPIFLGVRQDIASARRTLAAVELPDYFAISSALDSVQESIAQLPFQGEEQPQSSAAETAEEGWWAKLKGVFSGLVTVRRSTELEDQRISLEDKDYVRQRLWLQVEIAHLALMRRDQASFGSAIDRVRETLSVWFDPSSSAYGQVVAGLDELQATDIEAEIPDISKPWSTLQQVRQLRSRPAPAQPVPEPAAPEQGLEEAESGTGPAEAQPQ